MKRLVSYFFVAVWTALATVLQALCVEPLGLGAWTPDIPLFLLVAALSQLFKSDASRMALVSALARATFTVEPPFAIVSGTLAVALAADAVRRVAELSRPFTRALLVGAAAFGYGLWMVFVDVVRAGGDATEVLQRAPFLAPTAAASALLALLAWPLARKLPGLRSMERRAF